MRLRKAVFPVAGLGTRFLPATKANAKEMLPIVDKPLIQYAVKEAVSAGAEELVFITSNNKNSILDHFDKSYELEKQLEEKGKTALLQAIAAAGGQVIDLEGLAHHRGSAFGDLGDAPQPAQRLFESGIWQQLRQFDLSRPVFVEAESARVGRCRVPRRLWHSMLAAPRIEMRVPSDVRADFLLSAYEDIIRDKDRLMEALAKLKGLQSKETLAEWQALAEAGDYRALARQLMDRHYDPLYARSRKRRDDAPVDMVRLESLDDTALKRAAERLVVRA